MSCLIAARGATLAARAAPHLPAAAAAAAAAALAPRLPQLAPAARGAWPAAAAAAALVSRLPPPAAAAWPFAAGRGVASSPAPLAPAAAAAALVPPQQPLVRATGLPWLSLSARPSPAYKAVLIDAAGTLLLPTESTAEVYLRYGAKYGVRLSPQEVLERFRRAYNTPWGRSRLRYVGDGRPFWRFIVEQSTGCADAALFEEVYRYYVQPGSWALAPGAARALERLRGAGVRLAVVSNFDTRLRPILASLGVDALFDAVVVSAEVGAEKPNPVIFEAALQRLGLRPGEAVHVGDDRRNDVWGARDAGLTAWLWGVDVRSFDQVERKVLFGPAAAEEDDE